MDIVTRRVKQGSYWHGPNGAEWTPPETWLIFENEDRLEVTDDGEEATAVYVTAGGVRMPLPRQDTRTGTTHDEVVAFWKLYMRNNQQRIAAAARA